MNSLINWIVSLAWRTSDYIIDQLKKVLLSTNELSGKKVLVTAGRTEEPQVARDQRADQTQPLKIRQLRQG